ncbi:MAG: EF-P lysine aminoacylase EpmA [Bradymonadia bacterium]
MTLGRVNKRRPLKAIRPEYLRAYADYVGQIRAFFSQRDYVEVFPPVIVPSPGLEPHIEPFAVSGESRQGYLQTSPEYALKTLLATGLPNVYAITPCFRDEPNSATHSPQFTMLEWYRTGADLHGLMDETEALIKTLVTSGHGSSKRFGCDLNTTFERLSMREAFIRYAHIDPWQYACGESLRRAALKVGGRLSSMDDHWDHVFIEIFVNCVEPKLGLDRPCFIYGWPASQAALARLDPSAPEYALRFELFAGGFELANAFDELTDADEQRARFLTEQTERAELNRPVYPVDERFLEALENVNPCSGIALGVDRLVMLLLEVDTITEVQSW